ncbi:hypothetical protein C1645_812766 [Glomus cerebriforme]|uniref:AWS domain-containing protein n=1 Tax=Glomus cerebriforme TaxID=658196 RepID=A0A397TN60_9GLOM|nr:hypothetical protein C1645_812766 [Glomus cerebriforme]
MTTGNNRNNKYHIGLKFGIVKVCYSAGKLKLLRITDFSELYKIPSGKVLIREAVCLQNIRSVSESLYNCKSECNNNKCYYKKLDGKCGSRCHSGHSC